jgi:phosphoglycolate phosphatase
MGEVKHIIWDWNGTLFDDAWLCVAIMNGLLANRSLPQIDEERYQNAFTFPVETYYRSVGFDFTQEPFERLTKEFMEQYDQRHSECTLQPEVRTVLATLSTRGYTHSILSATEQARLENMVRLTDLREQFAKLAGPNDCYARGKTDQGRQLLSSLGCEPSEVVVIGDTFHDYEVALALGMGCMLIPSGHCSRERLASCGAKVFDKLSDLLAPDAPFGEKCRTVNH